jgi:tetratricopeptide (TPR) repeat protein
LEGELDFPLADGQTITRYALEINGNLREGVVVEKAKARIAYENTVRQNIDPGLVEKIKGNNFRTRIYPIPAKGYKRVVIGIEQKLDFIDQKRLYQLPLEAKQNIDSFSIEANVMHAEKPSLETASFNELNFERSEAGYEASYKKDPFGGNHLLAFSVPFDEDEPTVYTETINGKTYFYVNGRLDAKTEAKTKPSTIGLLWDISASADKRNKEQDFALLQKYLGSLSSVKVLLIPFHISPQAPQEFLINGNASTLIDKLKSFAADGGTQLGAMNLSNYAVDEFLLFSDGLSTFGKKEMVFGNKPVIAINSSPSADYSYLKYIAQQTKGGFIDLVKLDAATAAEQMNGTSVQALKSAIKEGNVESLVATIDPVNHSFSAAGILNSSEASLEISFGNINGEDGNTVIELKKAEASTEGVGRIWASLQVDELDLQFEKNKEQITALGKQFSIVTQNTSLLVLDRVKDYVEHEITPPAELQKEYFALLKEKQSGKVDAKKQAMDEALAAMEELKSWWNADYRRRKPTDRQDIRYHDIQMNASSFTTDSLARFQSSQNNMMQSPPPPGYFNMSPAKELSVDEDGVSDKFDEEFKSTSEIKIAEWKSDAEYLKKLDKATTQNALSTYLELKKQYQSQPSFFFDVAKWFFDKGQKETAILVLSNVAEMKLESPELLRMMAYQLLDMQEKDLAVLTFKEILNLREEEPQAYRDLALALNDAGRYQEAIDNLYKVVTEVWDGRFYGIKGIVLNEMNSIISAHKENVTTTAIDSRFIYAMPVDVRITIDWNTNDSDIDLWVTDPKKEKCFYENKETSMGGHISDDMTQGYGPEEFAVKKAAKGDYIIEANLYGDRRQTIGGPIIIRADLYTDFGKPTQQHKRINFRVTEGKEVVKVGSLKFM